MPPRKTPASSSIAPASSAWQYPQALARDTRQPYSLCPIDLVLHWSLAGDVARLGSIACVCKSWRLEARAKFLWEKLHNFPRRISDASLVRLVKQHGRYVTELNLRDCYLLTSACCVAFKRLTRLSQLDVCFTPLSASKLGAALSASNLVLSSLKVMGIRDRKRGAGLDALRLCVLSPEGLDASHVCQTRGCRRLSDRAGDGDLELCVCERCGLECCDSCASSEQQRFCFCSECLISYCQACTEEFCDGAYFCETCNETRCGNCGWTETIHYRRCDDCDSVHCSDCAYKDDRYFSRCDTCGKETCSVCQQKTGYWGCAVCGQVFCPECAWSSSMSFAYCVACKKETCQTCEQRNGYSTCDLCEKSYCPGCAFKKPMSFDFCMSCGQELCVVCSYTSGTTFTACDACKDPYCSKCEHGLVGCTTCGGGQFCGPICAGRRRSHRSGPCV